MTEKKLFLVKNENPCYDCSTEDIIAIFDSREQAEELRDSINEGHIVVEEVELNSVITSIHYTLK